MATFSTQNLRMIDFDGKAEHSGQLTIRHLSKTDRTFRALKFFGIFLALAFVSVFIPVLHFVLVPAFSLSAVGSAVMLFLQAEEVAEAKGTCPYCGKETALKRAMIAKEFRDSCEHCLQLITAKGERP